MSSKQLLPLSGVLSVLIIIAAFIVGGETPEADDSLAEVVSYYHDHDTALEIASGLLAVGGFFFLVFTAAIGLTLRRVQDELKASTILSVAGGIVFVVGVTLFAGFNFVAAETVGDVAPIATQSFSALNADMFFTVAVGTAAFLIGTGIGVLKSGALPKWLAWAAIVIGIVAITPAGFFGFLGLGVWTVVASIMLAMRAGDAGQDTAPRPAG